MIFFGLHLLDWIVIAAYFAVMVWVGRATASSVHGSGDFFLGGRKLGRWLQFFLNFGQMSDPAGAGRTSSLVYSQGVGGVWFTMQTLFMTPFYWFMNPWFRRARLTTVADLFADRFGGKLLPMIYAVCTVATLTVGLGASFLIAYKMAEFMIVKPEAEYTAKDWQAVKGFEEFRKLDADYRHGELRAADKERHDYLGRLRDRNEIKSYISYLKPLPVYLALAAIIGCYVILGGMTAAAITDAIQGVLIVIFSVILIPFGLHRAGGVAALHERIPDRLLELFGYGGGTDFAWYTVATILLAGMVSIPATPGNMAISGSARDETAAAIGAISGGFLKRWMIIAWCFCGLIAFAIFGGGALSDPDAVWGLLCRTLLGPGLLGLMLVGIMAADMSSISAHCLSLSALFVRNIYLPIFPNKTEEQGLALSRWVIFISLCLGIVIAMSMQDIIAFVKIAVTLNLPFGAAILVIFKWRRVTITGVLVSVLVSFFVLVIVPVTVPFIPALSRSPALLAMTQERVEKHIGKATEDDVVAGKAKAVGDDIERIEVLKPKPIFFERVLSSNPIDPGAPMQGKVRFNAELFLLSLLGVNLTNMIPAQLFALICATSSIFPFLLLFGVSLLTRDNNPAGTRRFYAKMRTRTAGDPTEDEHNLAQSYAYPDETEALKIFPGSSWELYRWRRLDVLAYFGCWLFVLFILATFGFLLKWGRPV